jgi:hypothetical protein
MPEWFARDDADGDGQVAMKEFSVSWTDAVLAEFNQFDINRDGLITPQECLAAKNQGAVRGGSIGGGPPSSSAPAGGMAVAVASEAAAAAPDVPAASAPASGAPPAAAKVDPRYYEYFKKVVIKYDTNNDGELTSNEWASMSKNPEAADTDRNGRITIEEYARWQMHR